MAHRKAPGIGRLPPRCAGHVMGSECEDTARAPSAAVSYRQGQAHLWPPRELRMLTASRVSPLPGSGMPALPRPGLTCESASLSRLGPASPTLPGDASLTVPSSPRVWLLSFGPRAGVALLPGLGSHSGKALTCCPPRPTQCGQAPCGCRGSATSAVGMGRRGKLPGPPGLWAECPLKTSTGGSAPGVCRVWSECVGSGRVPGGGVLGAGSACLPAPAQVGSPAGKEAGLCLAGHPAWHVAGALPLTRGSWHGCWHGSGQALSRGCASVLVSSWLAAPPHCGAPVGTASRGGDRRKPWV